MSVGSAFLQAMMIYGITAIVSFLVAVLIKGIYLSMVFLDRKPSPRIQHAHMLVTPNEEILPIPD